ncbi:membrane protein [Ligilactobacillus ruminis S23]|nr:membrane protein [Ligilactobacillus ruminis S23]
MGFWQRCLVNALVFLATAGFFPDALHVANVPTAFLAAIVLGLLNMSVKPILLVLSLPITVVTLGIFDHQRTDVGTDFCRDGRPVPIFKFYVSVYDCNRFEHRKFDHYGSFIIKNLK